jgi:hypothetical protein
MPIIQKTIAVLWPAFLMAGAATILFFTVFDPLDLLPLGDQTRISRLGIYTIGFFLFWILMALSSLLTLYFVQPSDSARNSRSSRP